MRSADQNQQVDMLRICSCRPNSSKHKHKKRTCCAAASTRPRFCFSASFSLSSSASRPSRASRAISASGLYLKCSTRVVAALYSPRPTRSCRAVRVGLGLDLGGQWMGWQGASRQKAFELQPLLGSWRPSKPPLLLPTCHAHGLLRNIYHHHTTVAQNTCHTCFRSHALGAAPPVAPGCLPPPPTPAPLPPPFRRAPLPRWRPWWPPPPRCPECPAPLLGQPRGRAAPPPAPPAPQSASVAGPAPRLRGQQGQWCSMKHLGLKGGSSSLESDTP